MEKHHLLAHGWHKIAEENIYANGCQPESTSSQSGKRLIHRRDCRGSYRQAHGLLWRSWAFVAVDDTDSVLVNACDEPGRVDVQVMEADDGHTVTSSDHEWKEWVAGRARLWLCTYIFRVQRVEPFEIPRELATSKGWVTDS